MDMTAIVYCPLLEEEEQIPSLAWEKDTLQYAINNKSRVVRVIRNAAKGMTNLNSMDIEDIYSDVLEYLYKSDDYDVQKAIEYSNSGNMVTLEGYVNSSIKYCVKRYITSTYRREKEIVRDVIVDDEGKEKEILDMVADEESTRIFNDIGYEVGLHIKSIEHKRYKFGVDIFLVLYVRLLTMEEGEDKYRKILEVLGVSKKDLNELEKKIITDSDIRGAIKAISLSDIEEATSVLEKEVYGAKKIKEVIASIK